MSGTIQTPSFLMSTEIVDNTTGLLTPGRMRDVVETFAGAPTVTYTASRVLTATDRGLTLRMNLGSALTVTVNSGVLLANQQFAVRQIGAGQVTIVAGAGLTRQSSTGTFATKALWSLIIVTVDIDGTTLLIDGDLA